MGALYGEHTPSVPNVVFPILHESLCIWQCEFVTVHGHLLLLWCAHTFRRQHLLSKLDSMEDSLMAVDSFDLEGYAAVGCLRHQ